jgi:hypothetical protein
MTHDQIIAELEAASRTMLALRVANVRPATGAGFWPAIVYDAAEAYGWSDAPVKPAAPSSRDITRMDLVLGWVKLIPADRYVLRRVVLSRAMVSPTTDRHMFTWAKLARVVGADTKSVQRWHGQGIGLIRAGLAGVAAPALHRASRSAAG